MGLIDNIKLVKFLNNNNYDFLQDELMSKHTTFQIGGFADFFVNVDSVDKLARLKIFTTQNDIPFFVIGNGSNLLVSDKGIEGVVAKISDSQTIKLIDKNTIICSAGVQLSSLCSFAYENELSGLEFAWGIPGTVGGAVYMNAGAFNGKMSDVVMSCEFIDQDGLVQKMENQDMNFDYRYSVFKETKNIITTVVINLSEGNKEEIKTLMDEYIQKRKEKQPLELPSAGSIFKRPKGNYAGTLIEKSGLKGFTVGGAHVSEKHAGFIVNIGNATSHDVISLVMKIVGIVFSTTGIILEPEIVFVGRK